MSDQCPAQAALRVAIHAVHRSIATHQIKPVFTLYSLSSRRRPRCVSLYTQCIVAQRLINSNLSSLSTPCHPGAGRVACRYTRSASSHSDSSILTCLHSLLLVIPAQAGIQSIQQVAQRLKTYVNPATISTSPKPLQVGACLQANKINPANTDKKTTKNTEKHHQPVGRISNCLRAFSYWQAQTGVRS